jgi:hypothetical protein
MVRPNQRANRGDRGAVALFRRAGVGLDASAGRGVGIVNLQIACLLVNLSVIRHLV